MYQTKYPPYNFVMPNKFLNYDENNKYRTIGLSKILIPIHLINIYKTENKIENFNFLFQDFLKFYENIFNEKNNIKLENSYFEFIMNYVLIINYDGYSIPIDLEIIEDEFKKEIYDELLINNLEAFKEYVINYKNKVDYNKNYVTIMGETKISGNIPLIEAYVFTKIKGFNETIFKDMEKLIYHIQNEKMYKEEVN